MRATFRQGMDGKDVAVVVGTDDLELALGARVLGRCFALARPARRREKWRRLVGMRTHWYAPHMSCSNTRQGVVGRTYAFDSPPGWCMLLRGEPRPDGAGRAREYGRDLQRR